MLDVTNNETRSWLQKRLKKLFESQNLDALCLDLGNIFTIDRFQFNIK